MEVVISTSTVECTPTYCKSPTHHKVRQQMLKKRVRSATTVDGGSRSRCSTSVWAAWRQKQRINRSSFI